MCGHMFELFGEQTDPHSLQETNEEGVHHEVDCQNTQVSY